MSTLNCDPSWRNAAILALLILPFLLLCGGCATLGGRPPHSGQAPAAVSPEAMCIVEGARGDTVTWETLVARAEAADVVLVGEQHDDLLGHQFEAALTKALLDRGPVAVCMEMFERDEQPFVDAYLAGRISQKTLVDVTDSMDWGAKGKWDAFYQPLVDAAKESGRPVIAANAPRRFTRIGRLEDFDRLASFAADYPDRFAVPAPIDQAAYRERFLETMRHHGAPPAPQGKRGIKMAMPPGMPPMTEEALEGLFRAQQVWDATMADSAVRACREYGKALLVVGQFHIEFEGGLLLRVKAAAPDLSVLTISLQRDQAAGLRAGDKGRADFVVYHPAPEEG